MPVDLKFDYDTAIASIKFYSDADIKELELWTRKLDNTTCVPKNMSNKQLLLFYNACLGDLDKTKICIEKYYNCRKNAPEFFNHRIFKTENLRIASELAELFILPSKSCQGYEVVYYRMFDSDYTKFDLESFCKLLLMTFDLSLLKSGPQAGYLMIFDMQGIQLGHLTKAMPMTLLKLFEYVQEAVPLRLQEVHVLNVEPLFDKILAIIKPFMSKMLHDMINLYNKGEDMEKFYKIVPKSSLPPDYGGTLPDTQTLHKQCMDELRSLEQYFKDEQDQRSAALSSMTGDNTLEGTFKKLEID